MEPLGGKIDNFINEIDRSWNSKAVFNVLEKHIQFLGFEYFTLQILHSPNGGNRPYFTSYPEGWVARYDEQNYVSHDMVSRYAARSLTPFSWAEIGDFSDFTDTQKRVFYEASEYGLNSGCSVPLHGPATIGGQLSVTSSASFAELRKLFHTCQHELHLVAAYAYEKLFEIGWLETNPSTFILTPRETEVMTWTAKGKTTWEVSRIINVSEQTVKNHLKSIANKLNAKNKAQAVGMALVNGLIVIH